MTIGEAFDATVRLHARREALVVRHQNLRYSWGELAEVVEGCARGLLGPAAGRSGRHLGTELRRVVHRSVRHGEGRRRSSGELEYVLKQSGCRWLICAEQFKSSDYHAMLAELIPELADSPPGGLHATRLADLRGVISLGRTPTAGMLGWAKLLGLAGQISRDVLRRRQAQLQFDDPINIQYTSGTTGFPKGATLSHYNILNNGYMVGESLGLSEHDRLVIPVPLYHCFGMVMGNLGCLTHGSTMIYPGDAFDPLSTLQAVAEERATVLYGVPTMFIAELDHPRRAEFDLSSLRTGIMAGATCPIEVMKRVIGEMHMAEVQIAYGMTETSPVSTQTGPTDDLERCVTSVGRTQPHLESKIVDEQGNMVPRGQIGELCTRGYSVMLGYWNNPRPPPRRSTGRAGCTPATWR